MPEEATVAGAAAIIAKTSRRVGVALTLTAGVGLLMLKVCRSAPPAFFFRTIVLGLSATAAFVLFEVWPPKLPRWFERWVLQVVAVGASVPIAISVMYLRSPRASAPPFLASHDWMILTLAATLLAPAAAPDLVVQRGRPCR